MAERAQMGTDIAPSFVARVAAGLRYAVTGKGPADWFGPMEPLPPIAPEEVKGRRFDFVPGYNLVTQPRAYEPITFRELRALADNYDLLRLIIETRKSLIATQKWVVRNRDPQKRKQKDGRIDAIMKFMARPDQEHDFDVWLRMLLEEMIVLDALTIYPRKTRGGSLYSLDVIDGGTIKRVIDDWGRTPPPPAAAYQQVLKGLPAIDFTSDELLYLPRNCRADRVYGYGPVEQIIMTVNIAIRRQIHQLQFYTEGTVPDALIGVPDSWSPDQIAQFQAYWDALLTDNTAERRHARFVPAGVGKSVTLTKEGVLKDEFDEWLARIMCYDLQVPYQALVKMMNRATAENSSEESDNSGDGPWNQKVKGVLDTINTRCWNAPDLEWTVEEEIDTDPEKQAQINNIKLRNGTKTIDECRLDDGLDPLPDGQGAVPLIYTAGGAVTLEDVLDPPAPTLALTQERQIAGEDPEQDSGQGGDAAPPPAQGGRNSGRQASARRRGASNLNKSAPRRGRPDRERSAAKMAEGILARIWSRLLAHEGARVAAQAATLMKKMAKADAPDGGADDPFDPLDEGAWSGAGDDTRHTITGLAQDGASEQLAILGVSTDLANPNAVAWANAHAAQLIKGLQATTRARLRDLVAQSETEGWSVDQLARAIQQDPVFDADRARLIAHQETRTADNQGALIAGKAAKADLGLAVVKNWLPRGDNVCAACMDNEAAGAIGVDEEFPSGADTAPAHVNCECDVEQSIAEEKV